MSAKRISFTPPQRPYRPLSDVISLIGMDSCFFSHNGVNYEVVATNIKPHVHTIKNCETGATSDMLHSKLLALSQC